MTDDTPTWAEVFFLIRRTMKFRRFDLRTKRRRPPLRKRVTRRRPTSL